MAAASSSGILRQLYNHHRHGQGLSEPSLAISVLANESYHVATFLNLDILGSGQDNGLPHHLGQQNILGPDGAYGQRGQGALIFGAVLPRPPQSFR